MKEINKIDEKKRLGINKIKGVKNLKGFGIELFIGFVIVIVVFGVCDVKRNEVKGMDNVKIGIKIDMGKMDVMNYKG